MSNYILNACACSKSYFPLLFKEVAFCRRWRALYKSPTVPIQGITDYRVLNVRWFIYNAHDLYTQGLGNTTEEEGRLIARGRGPGNTLRECIFYIYHERSYYTHEISKVRLVKKDLYSWHAKVDGGNLIRVHT